MIEATIILFIVGFAALHIAFKFSPKPAQQKFRIVIAAGLNKIGLDSVAQRLVAVGNGACGSGCDGCGTHATGNELKIDSGAKVVRFYPRIK
jgi:hypothetical protein